MTELTKTITLDLSRSGEERVIFAKQGDTNSRRLKINLTDAGTPYPVPQTAMAIITVERPDGATAAFQADILDDGAVTVTLRSWPLALAGEVKCAVTLFDGNKRRLTSANFVIEVEAALYSGDDMLEDENYTLVTEFMSEMVAINNAEEERRVAELAREEAAKNVASATQRANAISKTLEGKLAGGEFKGEKGERGEKGDSGNNGADGADGADGYTPLRGIDFWTPKDIATVLMYVDRRYDQLTAEGAPIELTKTIRACCANEYSLKEQSFEEWAVIGDYLTPFYTMYGYKLGKEAAGGKIKLKGTNLSGTFTQGSASDNIMFVKNFDAESGGICIISGRDVVATPLTFDQSILHEFLIEVPNDLEVDGVYLSCMAEGNGVGGLPEVELIQKNGGVALKYGMDSTCVTSDFLHHGNGWVSVPEKDTDKIKFAYFISNVYATKIKDVNPGEKYEVFCTPMNSSNLWENFIFPINQDDRQAVVANDGEVSKYVVKVSETSFLIFIPDGCASLMINQKAGTDFSVNLLS